MPLAWKNFGCVRSSPATDPDGVYDDGGGVGIVCPFAYKKVELEVFVGRGGLAGGGTGFASLAKKNFDSDVAF